jgi:hypothetical protein
MIHWSHNIDVPHRAGWQVIAGSKTPGYEDGNGVNASFTLPHTPCLLQTGMLMVLEGKGSCLRGVRVDGAMITLHIAPLTTAYHRNGIASDTARKLAFETTKNISGGFACCACIHAS